MYSFSIISNRRDIANMLRKILLTALLLPIFAVATLGHASATTDATITQTSLSDLILNGDEMNAALGVTNNSTNYATVTDVPPASTRDPVGVGRVFAADNGSFIIISLFAHPDGSPPAGKVLDGIFNGDMTKAAISGFRNIDGFTAGPSIVADDADKSFAFAGSTDGVDYHVYADSFVKGSVFGVIVYAVPTSL